MGDRISELPDCILSCILTTLSMKDLLKTSILSKRWCNLWGLRRDLCFDIHNVLGSSEEELLQTGYLMDVLNTSFMPPGFIFFGEPTMERHVNLDLSRNEFVNRVDQFVKNFKGTIIDSLLVNFSLDYEQSNNIDQWISFAIARGVRRINLLFLGKPYNLYFDVTRCNRYKFDFALFLENNASTLNHLHLENCCVRHPTNCDFLSFKNLRFLSLEETKLDETLIESLLSNCPRLEELCLFRCEFTLSMPMIASSSLCHLKVVRCYHVSKNNYKWELKLILLDCLKLTSLELDFLEPNLSSEDEFDILYFNAPMLKSIKLSSSQEHELNLVAALCATFFPELEIMHVTTSYMVTTPLKTSHPFKHLKQLNLIIYMESYVLDVVEYDSLWILNILQVSPLLQKLSVMFAAPEFFKNQKDIGDVEIFSHKEIKVVELQGCVGNWYEIELVMNVLKCAHMLEQIVVSPYWRENDSQKWKSDPVWFQNGRERMIEKLQGEEEVLGREKLVLM